ncbi:MAG: PKD domain-containing protein [Euryarchaeota archaeon]|nr:PKD domain-containing protein [Euryarchaeota archaeon]
MLLPVSLSMWSPVSVDGGRKTATVFDSSPSALLHSEAVSLENQPPTAVIGDLETGYRGTYFNLPADHPDVEGSITGVVPGDNPFGHDWYDDRYFSFQRIDSNLEFGGDFFPVDDGLPGDPHYFAVHWQANISVPADGDYSFLMGSDDDSWLYIDGELVIDLGGVHALEENTGSIDLSTGVHPLDIYFAERHLVQSGFYFRFLDDEVHVASVVIWDDLAADIGEEVTLKGSCSYDSDGTIVEHSWSFGDGSAGDGPAPEHAYGKSGTYTVTLTVTDDDLATGTDTCIVAVNNKAPAAEAGPDQTVCSGEVVLFDGSSSLDIGGNIVRYEWYFGDSATGNGVKTSHAYQQAGTYGVTLAVTDNEGAVGSDYCRVTVSGTPNIAYSIEYLDPADQTIVNGTGIWFFTSGAYPSMHHGVPYNATYRLPESDYGTYNLYNRSTPVRFAIHIRNMDAAAHKNLVVRAIQERHDNVTIWDRYGMLQLHKGDAMDGFSTSEWPLATIAPGANVTLVGVYEFEGRGWGLDQTHLVIAMGGTVVVDDPEAGVYCPP